MYIDESGDPGYPVVNGARTPTTHYILTGYILPKIDKISNDSLIKRFREQSLKRILVKYPSFPIDFEFHGTEIIYPKKTSIFHKLNIGEEDRFNFFSDIIKSFLQIFNMAKIFSVSIHKLNNRYGNTIDKSSIKYFAWYHLPARFERFLYYKQLESKSSFKLTGVVIADNSYNSFINKIFDEKMVKDIIKHFVFGYIDIPWAHIESKPTFVNSQNPFIQIADIIAYSVKLYILQEKYSSSLKFEEWYKWLEPLYLKEGTTTSNDAIYRM